MRVLAVEASVAKRDDDWVKSQPILTPSTAKWQYPLERRPNRRPARYQDPQPGVTLDEEPRHDQPHLGSPRSEQDVGNRLPPTKYMVSKWYPPHHPH